MKKLIEYCVCLRGGGMIVCYCIPKIDGGLLVVDVKHYPAVVPLAA